MREEILPPSPEQAAARAKQPRTAPVRGAKCAVGTVVRSSRAVVGSCSELPLVPPDLRVRRAFDESYLDRSVSPTSRRKVDFIRPRSLPIDFQPPIALIRVPRIVVPNDSTRAMCGGR